MKHEINNGDVFYARLVIPTIRQEVQLRLFWKQKVATAAGLLHMTPAGRLRMAWHEWLAKVWRGR